MSALSRARASSSFWTRPLRWLSAGLLLTAVSAPFSASADETLDFETIELLMPFSTLYQTGETNQILLNNQTRILQIQNNASASRRARAALDATIDSSRLSTFMGGDLMNRYLNGITGNKINAIQIQASPTTNTKEYFANANNNPQYKPSDFVPPALISGGSINVYGKMYGTPVPQFSSTNGFSDTNPRPYQLWPDPAVDPSSTANPFIEQFNVTQIWQAPSPGTPGKAIPYTGTNYDASQFLEKSAAFPSGHSTLGVGSSIIYGLIMPELYQQSILRGSDYAESRVVMGEHHVLDTLGGRIGAIYTTAYNLNNGGYETLITESGTLRNYLESTYSEEDGLLYALQKQAQAWSQADIETNGETYQYRLTYDLGDQGNATPSPVSLDEAGVLLSLRFPYLVDLGATGTDRFAAHTEIIRTTMNDVGGPLDNTLYGGKYAGWSLINLYAAGGGYAELVSDITVTMDASKSDVNSLWAHDTWSNDITGAGTLIKDQVGGTNTSLTLTGNNTFAGVTVEAGTLILTGKNDFTANSSVQSGGTLIVQQPKGGADAYLRADGDITVDSGGTLAVYFRQDNTVQAGADGSGAFTNNGTVLLYAAPDLAGGLSLNPIASADGFAGSGTFKAFGGTWAANTFTVSSVTDVLPSGDTMSINSFQLQGQRFGSDFDGNGTDDLILTVLNDSSITTNFSFSATDLVNQSAINGQNFVTGFDITTDVLAENTLLSFYVGEEFDLNQLALWHDDGSGWELVLGSLTSLGGGYYTFAPPSFSSYAITVPEPGTGALFFSAAALLAWRRRRA